MPENNPPPPSNFPNGSEGFGKLPNDAERFGTVPNASEPFRTFPKGSERKENHTLTVRDAARMFEGAGVARTERSITNWCQPNRSGIARLDAYFDPNERKYFITPQSVERAIKEEMAKATRENTPSAPVGSVPNASEVPRKDTEPQPDSPKPTEVKKLELEIMDLKIANRAKDYFIEQLQNERKDFALERKDYVEKLMASNHRVGELETKLLQLAPARREQDERSLGSPR